jgi:hypothetical protein
VGDARVDEPHMSKIVWLPGVNENTPLDEPDPSVIECLEGLLAEARLGQIRAFAFALVDGGERIKTNWCSRTYGTRFYLAGAVALLSFEYNKMLTADD